MQTNTTNTIALIIIIISSLASHSQNVYLKISEDNKTSVSYPPGTTFELTNKHGEVILKDTEKPLVFKIDEPYTLYIFPEYKTEKDVYNLSNGKIELVYNADYINSIKKHKNRKYQSYGVSLNNTSYMASTTKKGETNVTLEFSNGVVFKYTDGKVTATLNDQEIEVKGKYLIYSEDGVVKISYNPKNKQIWWTYEPIK